MTGRETAEVWKDICHVYDKTRPANSPAVTMSDIILRHSREKALETFAAVTKFKKYDGRIYGSNRERMEAIATAPELTEYTHGNPLIDTGLMDHIHTAHINNLITELLKNREPVQTEYKVRFYDKNGDLDHEETVDSLTDAADKRTAWGEQIGLSPEPSIDFPKYPTIWAKWKDGYERVMGY